MTRQSAPFSAPNDRDRTCSGHVRTQRLQPVHWVGYSLRVVSVALSIIRSALVGQLPTHRPHSVQVAASFKVGSLS
jgi:hypothetical protein